MTRQGLQEEKVKITQAKPTQQSADVEKMETETSAPEKAPSIPTDTEESKGRWDFARGYTVYIRL